MPQLEENTDIYIECYAVDEQNNIIQESQGGNSSDFLSLIKNDMKLNFGENIVLQASAGVSLMLIVFVMADYVFKIMPKNAINKKINGV